MIGKMLALAVLTAFSSPVIAQEAGCDLLLKDGVRDYQGQSIDQFNYEKIKNWLRTSKATTKDEAYDSATKVGIGIEDIISLSIADKSAAKNYSEWKEEFLSSNYSEFVSQLKSRSVLQKVSEALAKAFVECKKNATGTVLVWIDAYTDIDFAVFYEFQPAKNSNKNVVHVDYFGLSHAKCDRMPVRGEEVGPVKSILCTKDGPDEVSAVSLSTDEYGPEHLPIFAPYRAEDAHPTTTRTLSGIISAHTVRRSTRSFSLRVDAAPQIADIPAAGTATWTRTYTLPVYPNEHALNPIRAKPIVEPPLASRCSASSTVSEKPDNATEITIPVTVSCQLPPFSVSGPSNYVRALLLNGSFAIDIGGDLELRELVAASPMKIYEQNSLQSSWKFKYTIPEDGGSDWQYYLDIDISEGDGAHYNLHRLGDGSLDQMSDGPYRGVFSDEHILTIFRSPS